MNYFCRTCAYFIEQAQVDKPGQKSAIVSGGLNGSQEKLAVGFCKLNQPFMMAVPNALDPRQAQMQRSWPTTSGDDGCAHHPDNVFMIARKTAQAIRLDVEHTPGFEPNKYPDGGFKHPPTLAQAKAVSVVAQGDNVTEPGK